ncbi:permease prefix domain 1-containing protein [uncultured Schumannella sp.]|uniref:permease prefix domain 1-containing protein n=1 Tax=uncultured Schumannella sp. TaxID=1195956 RepID=UPI0025DC0908|nr:permease prefix domain 1-containing protein [uncultured Schumannella sp.]
MSAALEARIAEWRAFATRSRAVDAVDADELESHLRDSIDALRTAGLDDDEAFLVAAKRLGALDPISREFARVHSARLWKQLVLSGVGPEAAESGRVRRHELFVVVAFALGAAVLVQLLRLGTGAVSADSPYGAEGFRWFSGLLPAVLATPVIGYLAWLRRLSLAEIAAPAALVTVTTLALLIPPFDLGGLTAPVAALHSPVVLWFAVALTYLGTEWRSSERRMDVVRFTGEFAIYVVLIVLGGGVLFGLTSVIIGAIAPDAVSELAAWILPSGGAASLVVAAWLVESKQSVIENIAPVLTAIFTPLFAVMLAISAALYAAFGIGRDFDRELLATFDVVLVVVLALLLYGLSARRPETASRVMDVLRLVAIAAALALDALVLGSMFARIGEFGFTPNRVAALGLNVLLFANLAVAAALGVRALRGRGTPAAPESWQTRYLPVFGGWALLMVVALPPMFGYA